MSQIQDRVWIGSYTDAADQQFLNERRINCMLCCAEEYRSAPYNFINANKANLWYRVPIIDNVADDTTEAYLREGAAKINEWVQAGNTVIVHCYLGMSRSVSTVIAYLMIYKGWSFKIALSHVRFRRPQTNIHEGYLPILSGLIK